MHSLAGTPQHAIWRRHALQPAASLPSLNSTCLYVRRRIIWLSSTDPRRGYACHFPTISMHAVAAPSDDACDKPCLSLPLDSGDDAMGMMGGVGVGQLGGEGSDDGGEEGDDEGEDELPPPLPELRLVPADADQRESRVLSCAEVHSNSPRISSSCNRLPASTH